VVHIPVKGGETLINPIVHLAIVIVIIVLIIVAAFAVVVILLILVILIFQIIVFLSAQNGMRNMFGFVMETESCCTEGPKKRKINLIRQMTREKRA
jgi:hypothetical protein